MDPHTVVLDLGAPSRAREMVRNQLMDDLSAGSLEDVRLAISEVVAMFVRHSKLVDSSGLNIDIDRSDHRVRVSISSTAPDPSLPRRFFVPADADGGYGLTIIEAVSDRWGVVEDPPSVWFEIDRL